jgi:hypothetical protein
VIQEVEYVKEEDKLAYLLDCLQKTAPPVLVFAENKRDVDAIHEFLLVQVGPGGCGVAGGGGLLDIRTGLAVWASLCTPSAHTCVWLHSCCNQ